MDAAIPQCTDVGRMSTICPSCGESGRKVGTVTVDAQVEQKGNPSLASVKEWRFCRTAVCSAAYFSVDNAQVIPFSQLKSLPFPKSLDPDRRVCFCFGHTVADVLANPALKSAIVQACRAGQDDCQRLNPEGLCCLGNVASVIGAGGSSCCA